MARQCWLTRVLRRFRHQSGHLACMLRLRLLCRTLTYVPQTVIAELNGSELHGNNLEVDVCLGFTACAVMF